MVPEQHEMIGLEDLPPSMIQEGKKKVDKALGERYTFDQLEKKYIRRGLIEVGGKKSKVAVILGLDRKTLYRRFQ